MTGSSTNKSEFQMKKKGLWVHAIVVALTAAFLSCEYNANELGTDILPPGDNVIVYYDTIFEIDAYTMTGKPLVTSEVAFDANTLMVLGSMQDTIIGK